MSVLIVLHMSPPTAQWCSQANWCLCIASIIYECAHVWPCERLVSNPWCTPAKYHVTSERPQTPCDPARDKWSEVDMARLHNGHVSIILRQTILGCFWYRLERHTFSILRKTAHHVSPLWCYSHLSWKVHSFYDQSATLSQPPHSF